MQWGIAFNVCTSTVGKQFFIMLCAARRCSERLDAADTRGYPWPPMAVAPSEECKVGSQHPQVGHDTAARTAGSRRQLLLLPERQLEVAEQQIAIQEGALLQRLPAAAAATCRGRLLQEPPPATANLSSSPCKPAAESRANSTGTVTRCNWRVLHRLEHSCMAPTAVSCQNRIFELHTV